MKIKNLIGKILVVSVLITVLPSTPCKFSNAKDGFESRNPVMAFNIGGTKDGLGRIIPSNPQQPTSAEVEWTGDYVYFGTNSGSSIKWRVLNNDGNNLMLMTDYVAGRQAYKSVCSYSAGEEGNVWEKSTLRTWLNKTYYDFAFTDEEKKDINISTVVNGYSGYSKYNSGADTRDKVYVLSMSELANQSYGFCSEHGECKSRRFYNNEKSTKATSIYTRTMCKIIYGSPYAIWVDSEGYFRSSGSFLSDPVTWEKGVCPVISIKLSSTHWTNQPIKKTEDTNNTISATASNKITIPVTGRFKDGELKKNILTQKFTQISIF